MVTTTEIGHWLPPLSAGGGHVKIKTKLGEELNGGGGNREGSEAHTGLWGSASLLEVIQLDISLNTL